MGAAPPDGPGASIGTMGSALRTLVQVLAVSQGPSSGFSRPWLPRGRECFPPRLGIGEDPTVLLLVGLTRGNRVNRQG